MKARQIRVEGRVQGVGFRAFVAREAVARGIVGEVWNTADGAVEAVAAHGDPEVLAELERRLGRGPGRVDRVLADDAPPLPRSGFSIGATR